MKLFGGAAFAAIVFSFLALAPAVHASALLYTLDVDQCTGTCGTPPFGTVELDQINAQTVLVSLSLMPGEGVVQTGSSSALMFNIGGNPQINITNLTSGFVVLTTGLSAAGLGTFDYGVDCGAACGPGASKSYTGVLSFDVARNDLSDLFTGDFAPNDGGIYFATDIIGTNGNTGPVGGDLQQPGCVGECSASVVPEPVSFVLVGSGLIGAYFLRRRRRS